MGAPPASAAEGEPTRILIAGDSITHGYHGDYTYRYRLWREFQRQDVAVDFVGSRTMPYHFPDYPTSTYADPNFDQQHFARAGGLLSTQAAEIAAEASGQTPDVVVVASGVNDLLHGRTPQQVAASLQSFIDNLRSARPEVTIVVSPVLTVVKKNPGINDRILEYDALAADIVAASTTVESPIILAPTMNGWTPSTSYVQDGIHLTPRGEFFVANRIAFALKSAGILTADPATVPAAVTWVRNVRPTVRQTGHNAVVTWDTQALTGARVWYRRGTGAWRYVTTTRRQYTHPLTPGAPHDFRVQAIRGVMMSTISANTRFTAARLQPVTSVAVRLRRVIWTPVYGATRYRVHYRVRGTATWRNRWVQTHWLRARAAVAEVVATNPWSRSVPTTGRRAR